MKKLLKSALLFAALAMCVAALGAGSFCAAKAEREDICYKKLAVTVKGALDNSFAVTEKITAEITIPTRGVIHTIPINSNSGQNAKVTGIKVTGAKFKAEKDKVNYYIMIGDPKKFANGKETYSLSYKYSLGKDANAKRDIFSFNFVEGCWARSVSGLSFSVQMPAKFDKAGIRFLLSGKDVTNSKELKYSVKGNTISGSYGKTIAAGSSFALELPLKEGYFSKAK